MCIRYCWQKGHCLSDIFLLSSPNLRRERRMKRDSDTQRQIVGKVWKLKIKASKDQHCAISENVKIDFYILSFVIFTTCLASRNMFHIFFLFHKNHKCATHTNIETFARKLLPSDYTFVPFVSQNCFKFSPLSLISSSDRSSLKLEREKPTSAIFWQVSFNIRSLSGRWCFFNEFNCLVNGNWYSRNELCAWKWL